MTTLTPESREFLARLRQLPPEFMAPLAYLAESLLDAVPERVAQSVARIEGMGKVTPEALWEHAHWLRGDA